MAPAKIVRILLIEDNQLLREGISAILQPLQDMEVLTANGDREKSLATVRRNRPDIILLDVGLRSHSSLHFVKTVVRDFGSSRVVVMQFLPSDADVYAFVQAGAAGFIMKDASVDEFLDTIRRVAHGSTVLPPPLTDSLFTQIVNHAIHHTRPEELMRSMRMTKREREVVQLVADGLTNKEIAQQLHLSTHTVKSHIHNILEKLALQTRVQIAGFAHGRYDTHAGRGRPAGGDIAS
ncbi:MAG: response regulator transcription factor [Bacteroidetes bacterium]|nr:response regulator transcription factor [Bacteroidota bacterium]